MYCLALRVVPHMEPSVRQRCAAHAGCIARRADFLAKVGECHGNSMSLSSAGVTVDALAKRAPADQR